MNFVIVSCAISVALSAAPTSPPPRSSPDVDRPLKWLISAQAENGGWGEEIGSKPDVATTAISGISLLRMGFTASSGTYQENTRRAVDFVVHAVEAVPYDDPSIQPPGTLPQRKLGRYVDTFLAAQFLAEAMPGIPKGKLHSRAGTALDFLVHKVQKLQRGNGSFEGGGWAPVLGSAFASDALHAAKGVGSTVPATAVAAADGYLAQGYDAKSGTFKTNDSAGVALYTVAGAAKASSYGVGGGGTGVAADAALQDESTLRGFGSYGGEEHVSYMMTSEALARVGGKKFEDWDRKIRVRLANIQRPNGTWRGDHCITSTSFCTAASLITLAVKPVTAELPKR